ncbi:MAG: holo-ACP synthase [Bdellovibrionales bacterium]
MIIGIGSDLANIERIRATLEKHGAHFVQRVFAPAERTKASKKADAAASYAKRFAAKEACAKALGTGIGHNAAFREMCVVNLSSGKPTMVLSGNALKRLKKITPKGAKAVIHLSLSDDKPFAQAVVIIEALPVG